MKGGKRLSEILGTPLMDPEGIMTLSMVCPQYPNMPNVVLALTRLMSR